MKGEPFISYDYHIDRLQKYMRPVRIAFGLSLEDLADILGMSRIGLMNYESGKRKITPVMYLAIRGALYDVAQQVQDREYYEQIWFLFIEGNCLCKHHENCPGEIIFTENDERVDDIAKRICEYAKSYRYRRWYCLCDVGLEIKDILEKEWPEFFDVKGEHGNAS